LEEAAAGFHLVWFHYTPSSGFFKGFSDDLYDYTIKLEKQKKNPA